MLYKKCYDILNTRPLLCEILKSGFRIKTVIKRDGGKIIDLISDECIELSDANLLSFTSWSDDDRELYKFVYDSRLKLDFLNKLLKDRVFFNLNYYFLSVDKIEFFKNQFGGNFNEIKKFKVDLIHGFCDDLYNQLKDLDGVDINHILNSISQLKTYNLEDLNSIEEVVTYWPTILEPNPFNI